MNTGQIADLVRERASVPGSTCTRARRITPFGSQPATAPHRSVSGFASDSSWASAALLYADDQDLDPGRPYEGSWEVVIPVTTTPGTCYLLGVLDDGMVKGAVPA